MISHRSHSDKVSLQYGFWDDESSHHVTWTACHNINNCTLSSPAHPSGHLYLNMKKSKIRSVKKNNPKPVKKSIKKDSFKFLLMYNKYLHEIEVLTQNKQFSPKVCTRTLHKPSSILFLWQLLVYSSLSILDDVCKIIRPAASEQNKNNKYLMII